MKYNHQLFEDIILITSEEIEENISEQNATGKIDFKEFNELNSKLSKWRTMSMEILKLLPSRDEYERI